ncbi:L-seryl-tRNA(Sec) selenium transferase [Pseudonocardia sp. KRD-184]|uniref:L-seryl-tRNA(Sec) selenium transferase n=1 Tax=Pseudonocardia oceani TaxID=2792013 RepID=A0ABS6UCP1_9PSEU|nr:L-seryl-tRNA(Sec) selenium transferase [Pseudonocardia oceani]MBW0093663.1 L-seryl-tRNA(Sec) selenium transferase [Pseudonocardia oceani]MBW0100332.1 L-seryl-tRNA(Sec) selenium transferase [Pseudonocardia oceani]MBW0113021.1 L-seryl-tRNA(Sec) selenium transferase [Pseudonocardia oceani]MBW0125885.1 L-seryl-tRNA(Sec) selenium transferase [Pseudonocardia oceani]MBW0130006.1 L-seryl-tRNA(Sec) selenium transferase [Pseudonocardia oceani]
MTDARRLVPRTDTVLAEPAVADAARRLGRAVVKGAVVAAQDRARRGEIGPADVPGAALAALPSAAASLTPVVNATGVLLHTNLGRAPLSAAAREALDLAAGACDVELDLATGGRGARGAATVDALLAAVPGAAAAHVLNNGAAAIAMVAAALAGDGREIVIARGELVEIGAGFRIPDLLTSTGARLHEVGTTNRVSPADYADAVGPDTAFVLKVHPSNFVVTGFTRSCEIDELTGLGVPVVADIGSGLLAPHPLLPDEPDAATTLARGAALVTASGDKLLGGPQAGLLLGGPGAGAELVARIRRHPLARAVRVDKLTLAALEATLRGPVPPVRVALDADAASLRARAEALAARLPGVDAVVVDSVSTVGGGGAPGVTLPSAALSLPEPYAAALRAGRPAVLGRLEHGRCLLDLRAVPPESDDAVAEAVAGAPCR